MLQLVGGKITNESTLDLITSEGTSLQMRIPLHHECGTLFTPAASRDKVDEQSFDMFGHSAGRHTSCRVGEGERQAEQGSMGDCCMARSSNNCRGDRETGRAVEGVASRGLMPVWQL